MKRIVVFPSDPMAEYLKKGQSYEYYENLFNPSQYFDEVYCLSPWGEEKEYIEGNVHYIKDKPYKYKDYIKKIDPLVVRGYGGYHCADWVSYNKVNGIPSVVSVHDTNPELIHDSLAFADMIICMSEAVKKAVIDKVKKIDCGKIHVMPNRIDVGLFKKKYDKSFFDELNKRYGENYKHIIHVGRKAEQKNLDTLIKSLKYLGNDVNCIFIGQGNADPYKKLAEEEGVVDRCYWIERIQREDLPLWYSWADCMCTPSRWEGFGMVFIEAAACECPVVTSNIAPMNEYLSTGKNAILVDDFENPKEISRAIKSVFEGEEYIQVIKENARDVGLAFSKEKIDKMEIELYEMVIKSKANGKNNNLLLYKHWVKDFFGL